MQLIANNYCANLKICYNTSIGAETPAMKGQFNVFLENLSLRTKN